MVYVSSKDCPHKVIFQMGFYIGKVDITNGTLWECIVCGKSFREEPELVGFSEDPKEQYQQWKWCYDNSVVLQDWSRNEIPLDFTLHPEQLVEQVKAIIKSYGNPIFDRLKFVSERDGTRKLRKKIRAILKRKPEAIISEIHSELDKKYWGLSKQRVRYNYKKIKEAVR